MASQMTFSIILSHKKVTLQGRQLFHKTNRLQEMLITQSILTKLLFKTSGLLEMLEINKEKGVINATHGSSTSIEHS